MYHNREPYQYASKLYSKIILQSLSTSYAVFLSQTSLCWNSFPLSWGEEFLLKSLSTLEVFGSSVNDTELSDVALSLVKCEISGVDASCKYGFSNNGWAVTDKQRGAKRYVRKLYVSCSKIQLLIFCLDLCDLHH
jgi:hypothetical protein